MAVASAIHLILEFSQACLGLFRISPESVDPVVAELSANEGSARLMRFVA